MFKHLKSAIPLMLLAACPGASLAEPNVRGEVDAIQTTARDLDLGQVSGLRIQGPDEVRVSVGGPASIAVEGPAAVAASVSTEVADGILTLSRSGAAHGATSIAVIHLTLPDLRSLVTSGPGAVSVNGLRSADFEGDIQGAGDVALMGVDVPRLHLAHSGAGAVVASGEVKDLEIENSGSGGFHGSRLTVGRAVIKASGTGPSRARVVDAAEVLASGIGSVDVGSPKDCKVRRTGTGKVICRSPG